MEKLWISTTSLSYGLKQPLRAVASPTTGLPVIWESKFPYCLNQYESGILLLLDESTLTAIYIIPTFI